MPETLEVRPGDVSVSEIEDAWKDVIARANDDEDLQSLLVEHGLRPDALSDASVKTAEVDGDGGLTIAIAIASPVAVHVLQSLWDDYVRPRLRESTRRDAGDVVDDH
jgi:hypothetical protein